MAHIDFGLLIRLSSFGLGIGSSELVEYNQRCIEALSDDFTSIWMEGHLQWDGDDNLECFTTLSYLAGQFQRFYVGSLVRCQSFRNPALLAKMAANLQFISNGRFILGLGAGWKEDELQAYRYSILTADVRWSQFEEVINIVQGMWKGQPASYSGTHFQTQNAYCVPSPMPTIPILIGGGGSTRTLPLVTRYANWWKYNSCPPEDHARTLRSHHECYKQIGRDPGDIRLTYTYLFGND